jgi:hypothetical protein
MKKKCSSMSICITSCPIWQQLVINWFFPKKKAVSDRFLLFPTSLFHTPEGVLYKACLTSGSFLEEESSRSFERTNWMQNW